MRLVTLIVCLFCALHTLPAASQQFDELIVFGDSHSDTGNWLERGVVWPPLYFPGRASNGPVWVEELALRLDVSPPVPSEAGGSDYAWGGARTGQGFDVLWGRRYPQVGTQVSSYLSNNTPSPGDLHAIFVGHNDFTAFGQTDPTVPVTNIAQDITTLAAAGGRHFLVPNLHPLGHLPGYRGTISEVPLNEITQDFNDLLADELSTLQDTLDVTIYQYDFFGLIQDVITEPAAFGMTNATDTGMSGGVSVPNPDEYLYWDEDHFTTALYQIMGQQAATIVPEPASLVLSVWVLACVLMLRRRDRR